MERPWLRNPPHFSGEGPEDPACAAAAGAQRRAVVPSEARGTDGGAGMDRGGGAKEPWKRRDDAMG